MSCKELVTLIWGVEVGRVTVEVGGRLRFAYTEGWRGRDDAVVLSLSMPLAMAEHTHRPTHAYLSGLLPDNPAVLDRWGKQFHVSARNAFALISHVGEDCAGAAQFLPPERVEAVRAGSPDEVQWLTEGDIEARLRTLREDQGAWRSPGDTGQFSLAGAQPKTAFLLRDGRFGVPSGRTPTTHILKPPLVGRPGHAENEHICLALARALGLPAASSEVRRFGGEIAVVVTRYDRAHTAELAAAAAARAAAMAAAAATADGRDTATAAAGAADAAVHASTLAELAKVQPVLRLHQEDMCQAMGLLPTAKYQSEGGPTPARVVQLLREHSSQPAEDIATFVGALAFNWLIAGTDAHAKNYSLLHASGSQVRLAPLYDLASALPLPGVDLHRLRMAMRIGSEYRIRNIVRRHWEELAGELSLDADATVEQVLAMAAEMPARLAHVRDRAIAEGLDPAVVEKLAELLFGHIARCQRALESGAPA